MPEIKSWEEMVAWQRELLERTSGEGLGVWKERIRTASPPTEAALREWLGKQGVTGYAQMLLVHETFGYPEFLTKSAEELIAGQYDDREGLRPILDAVLLRVAQLGEVTVQARKTYVSLVGPRRTFAVVRASTRTRVDLGLRLTETGGRVLEAKSLGNDTINARVALASVDDVDDEVAAILARAYTENL